MAGESSHQTPGERRTSDGDSVRFRDWLVSRREAGPLGAKGAAIGRPGWLSVGSSVMNRRLGIGREGGIGGRAAQQV
jgi:hypothetical protein